MKPTRTLLLLAAAALAARPLAAAATLDPAARFAELRRLADSVHYETGTVNLRGGLARLTLPEGYHYLNPADTATVLERIWRNPKQKETLGMITPPGFHPLRPDGWSVLLTYAEDGYVKDDDASKIDYTDLLQKMKEGMRQANEARQKAGYPPMELVGWAAPPRYDAAAHKLYWAKEIRFGSEPQNTLNYNIRILGRRGVLVLNAISGMAQLPQVEAATPTLLSMVDFQEGNRYADFRQGTDKVATYGLAALVAGGLAAKAGLLKGLWVAILAMKKLLLVAVVALAAFLKKIWHWIRGTVPAARSPGGQPPGSLLS